jgi:hypothetical protein
MRKIPMNLSGLCVHRVIQLKLFNQDLFKRNLVLAGNFFLPYLHTNHDSYEGFCSKRDCLAVILPFELKGFDCP